MFKILDIGKIRFFCKVINSTSLNIQILNSPTKLYPMIQTKLFQCKYITQCNRSFSQQNVSRVKKIIDKNKEKLKITETKIKEKSQVIIKDLKDTKERVQETVGEIIEKENIYTIPNLLCVSRILLTPYLGVLVVNSQFDLALIVLGVAALTDLLDGWIARTWKNQLSIVGSFLDPIADKLLVGTLFLTLTYVDLIPIVLTGGIIARDVVLVIAGSVVRYKSLPSPRTFVKYFDVTYATVQLSPTFISKINTGVQLLLVGSTLAAPVFNYVGHPFLEFLWYVTGATTAASFLSYVLSKNTYKIFKKSESKKR